MPALESMMMVGQAAAGLAQPIVTALINRKNIQLQKEANEKNIQLMREQRSYNSPINQVARLSAAGLNPALAGIDNGNQSDLPTMAAPQLESPNVGAIGDALNNDLNYINQQKLTNSLVDLRKAQRDLAIANSGNVELQNAFLEDTYGLRFDELQAKLSKLSLECSNLVKAGFQIDEQTRNIVQDTKNKEQYYNNLLAQYDLTYQQVEESKARVDNLIAQNGLLAAQTRKFAAEAQISETQAKYILAYMDAYGAIKLKQDGIEIAVSSFEQSARLKIARRVGDLATIQMGYDEQNAKFESWYKENQAELSSYTAAQAWDEWQQGQARKNYETYGLGTVNSLAQGVAASSMLLNGGLGSGWMQPSVVRAPIGFGVQ